MTDDADRKKTTQANRQGKRVVSVWLHEPGVDQLKHLGVERRKNLTELAAEAFDLLLERHGKLPIFVANL
jgi:hypothetical protein